MSKLEMFAVRMDSELKHKIKVVALEKRITVQEYLNDVLESVVNNEIEILRVLKELEKGNNK